jgi:uncharacterized membrane protein YccC
VRAVGGNALTDTRVRTSVAALVRDAARLDRTQSDPVVSLRNAIGVVAPLAIGALTGNASVGLASTIGALQAGFADRPGPYRLRMLRMLGTALAAGITSGLAVVASRSDAGSVVLLLVLGFVAGLLLSGGPSATQVGVAGVAAALIIGHISQPASGAPHVGLLVFAGGAGQALLAVAAWPLRRHRPERIALAALYGELGDAARARLGDTAAPPAGATLTAVRQTLYGLGHDHGPSVEAYRVLLDEAERIRREIVAVVGIGHRLADEGDDALAGHVWDALTSAGAVLDDIAAGLAQGRPVRDDVLESARHAMRSAIEQLSAVAASEQLTRRAAAGRLRALSGQLRAAVESTRSGATEGRRDVADDRPALRVLRDPLAILRANLSIESAVLWHAVRLSALVAGSDLAVRLAGVNRGYWIPLTLLVVLRPDFAATFQRAVMRVLGTVLGLLVATALVHWVPGGEWWRVALIGLFAFGMRFAGPGNLALSAMCLSGLVVVLLQFAGVPAHSTVDSRALATLAGGGLAVLAVLAAPTWERRFVRVRLADLVSAYLQYVRAVADPGSDRATLQRTRAACRLARSNAQASIDRARSEPVRGSAEVELGSAVLAHTHRFVSAMLAVDAVRVAVRDAGGASELSDFLGSAGDLLDAARAALLADEAPGPAPTLRPRQEQLADSLLGQPELVGGIENATTLAEATDRITNSLDTLLAELRRQLPIR